MAAYLSNSFSLNMINVEDFTMIRVRRINFSDVPKKNIISIVGHQDTARIVSEILGCEVPVNRVSISIEEGDYLYIAQYKGPRLPEGATQLPEGATIEFFEVTLRRGCEGCSSVDCNHCGFMDWSHGA